MPNWCDNTLFITVNDLADTDEGVAELHRFIQDHNFDYCKDEKEEQGEFVKIPVDLNGQIYLSFTGSLPIPSDEKLDELNTDAYHWCVDNWGTKWDPSDVSADYISDTSITYSFQTAWAPPNEWIKNIANKYPSLIFKLEGVEPAMDYYGELIAYTDENDELIIDEIHDSYIEYLFNQNDTPANLQNIYDCLVDNYKNIQNYLDVLINNLDVLDIDFRGEIMEENMKYLSKPKNYNDLHQQLSLIIVNVGVFRICLDYTEHLPGWDGMQEFIDKVDFLIEDNNDLEFYQELIIEKTGFCKKYFAIQKIEQAYKSIKFLRFINGAAKKSRLNREITEFSLVPPEIIYENGWQDYVPFKLIGNRTGVLNHCGSLVKEIEWK